MSLVPNPANLENTTKEWPDIDFIKTPERASQTVVGYVEQPLRPDANR